MPLKLIKPLWFIACLLPFAWLVFDALYMDGRALGADPIEAIRMKPPRLAVIRGGKVIARSPARVSSLSLDGRPATVDHAGYAPKAV